MVFKGWLSFGIPEMDPIEIYIVLSVFRPEGWRVKAQALLYLRNTPGRWQLELVCKFDEIIFLHLRLGQDVNCPICERNCFNRPTVRREEDDPISTVDIPCFKFLANSWDLVNRAMKGELCIMWTRRFSHHRIKRLFIRMTEWRRLLAMETYRLDCQQNICLILWWWCDKRSQRSSTQRSTQCCSGWGQMQDLVYLYFWHGRFWG